MGWKIPRLTFGGGAAQGSERRSKWIATDVTMTGVGGAECMHTVSST